LGFGIKIGYNLNDALNTIWTGRGILFPNYTRIERLVDGCIHGVGVIFSLTASVALLASAASSPALDVGALAIYSSGMIAMFVSSACYNLSTAPVPKELFRRFDHAAIYIMIAGSYTPFALIKLNGTAGLTLFVGVWTIAVIGVAMKFAFPRRFEGTSIVFYLAQGWAILLALDPLISSISNFALWLLAVGGITYTIGVAFHLAKQLPFHNAIWHSFVLIAASCHYAAIYETVIPLD
jgi:hemolysin III